MHKVCRINLDKREEIYKSLDKFILSLKDVLPVRMIYLFGSFATGDINEASDIDLLVVGDFKERFFDRIEIILALTDLPVEPWVYTMEEFEEMQKNHNPFILEVLQTGKRVF